MEKIYHYKNGIVSITKPTEEQYINIQKSTEKFMEKVIRGDNSYGNSDKTRDIDKK